MATVFNIRGVPEELAKAARYRAFDEGISLRQLVINAVEKYVEETRNRVRKGKADSPSEGVKASQTDASDQLGARGETKATASGPAEVSPSKKFRDGIVELPDSTNPYCKTHRQHMKDFGNSWVCPGPPQHKEMK